MSSQTISTFVIRSHASAGFAMTGFGAVWGMSAWSGLAPQYRTWLLIAVVVMTLPLLYLSISLWRDARQLISVPIPADGAARNAKIVRGINVVAGVQFAAILLAVILLGRANQPELIPLVVALLVGLHFLPIAAIVEMKAYYVTGIALIVLAAAALLGTFAGWTLAWAVIVGLGSAIILWLTSAYVLARARRLLTS